MFISSGSFIREALPLPGAPVGPYNPPSVISCTSRAATRITASLFHSLPEPWRMDEVRGDWHHLLPGTPNPCWYSLSRTDTRHYLCLHPAPPTPALSPSSTCRGLPRYCLLAETFLWVCRLSKKPSASLPLWKAPWSLRGNSFSEAPCLTWREHPLSSLRGLFRVCGQILGLLS